MSEELNFNFCIIPNPFASGGRNIIFISKSGENFLDKDIVDSSQYKDVKEILEQFGYTETEHLQFESSNNIPSDEVTMTDMRLFLEDCGLTYSRELEVNVVGDLSNLKSNMDSAGFGSDFKDESTIDDKTKNKLIESKSELFDFKYKEPEYKEKVSLYFYLFLEFGFNHYGKPIIQFGGDFKDSDDYDDRNYIKIVKSDFERVRDSSKPNSIILSSCKKQKELLKEAGMLYSGYFRYQKNEEKGGAMILKEEKHVYKLADIRKYLNPEQSIIVETNRMGYDKLIALSKRIKTESIIEGNKYISTEDIEEQAEDLKNHFLNKMDLLSEMEEFEAAANMKKDVDFIDDKLNSIKEMDKPELTTEEYFKLFYIP
jgi:hypothetical protein